MISQFELEELVIDADPPHFMSGGSWWGSFGPGLGAACDFALPRQIISRRPKQGELKITFGLTSLGLNASALKAPPE